MDKNFTPVPGYQTLGSILLDAYNQAARTKGAERHANGLPFDKQPMQTVADQRGVGFLLGQADKKSIEAQRMLERGEVSKARHELLGAINYIAGAILFVDRTMTPKQDVGVGTDPGHGMPAPEQAASSSFGKTLADACIATYGAKAAPDPLAFKEGDRVRITSDVKKAEAECRASRAGWIPDLHDQCGALGTVTEVTEYGTALVRTLGGGFFWPFSCLERAPVEQDKEEPTIAVHMVVLDDSDPDVEAIQRMLANFLKGTGK